MYTQLTYLAPISQKRSTWVAGGDTADGVVVDEEAMMIAALDEAMRRGTIQAANEEGEMRMVAVLKRRRRS